jgi:CheY-like chemotaxis protein
MGQLIGRSGRLLKRLIGEHIALTVEVAPGIPAVEADPVQIEQVLMNLAINARDAMPSGGSLHLTLARSTADKAFADRHPPMIPGEFVRLQVTDTGCGMSESTRERAFEPFFTTKGLQGTGLGLSTVYGIVKQSGGYIWVTSEPGQGTTFSIYLPVTTAIPAVAEPAPVQPRKAATGATILLTEDDDDVRAMLAGFLRSGGHVVIEARDPAEALHKATASQGTIDLLVSDVVMPGITGPELARQLTEVRPKLKLLLMSGYPDAGGPGVPFLAKPFTRASLLSTIDGLLR